MGAILATFSIPGILDAAPACSIPCALIAFADHRRPLRLTMRASSEHKSSWPPAPSASYANEAFFAAVFGAATLSARYRGTFLHKGGRDRKRGRKDPFQLANRHYLGRKSHLTFGGVSPSPRRPDEQRKDARLARSLARSPARVVCQLPRDLAGRYVYEDEEEEAVRKARRG